MEPAVSPGEGERRRVGHLDHHRGVGVLHGDPGGSGSNGEPPLLTPLFTGGVTPVPALGTDDAPEADDVLVADDVPEEDVVPEGDRLMEGGDVQAASSRSTTIKNPSRRMGDLFSRCAPSVTRDAGGWEECGGPSKTLRDARGPVPAYRKGLLPACGRRTVPTMDGFDPATSFGTRGRTALRRQPARRRGGDRRPAHRAGQRRRALELAIGTGRIALPLAARASGSTASSCRPTWSTGSGPSREVTTSTSRWATWPGLRSRAATRWSTWCSTRSSTS